MSNDVMLLDASRAAVQANMAIERAATSVIGFSDRISEGVEQLFRASQYAGASMQGMSALDYPASSTGDEAILLNTGKAAAQASMIIGRAATSVIGFTARIAGGMEQLYWAAQRAGASVQEMSALGYAASQTGGSVEVIRSSLEGLSQFMHSDPGNESFLSRLGVQTRDASGQMRDMAAVFADVGQKLSTMPMPDAQQYARTLGIDDNTLLAMRRGVGEYLGQYSAMQKALNFNPDKAAEASNRFMISLRSLGQMAGLVQDKIGGNLADGLAGSLDTLRKRILDNFPKIEGVLTTASEGVLGFAEGFIQMTMRGIEAAGDVGEWWDGLSDNAKELIETLGGLVAGWLVLNTAFMASPLGLVTTAIVGLAAGLLLLYDDFSVWKEGGESLIDWDKWAPVIDYVLNAFQDLGSDLLEVYQKLKALGSALVDAGKSLMSFIHIDTSQFSGKWLFDQIIEGAKKSTKVLGSLVEALTRLVKGDFSGAFDSLKDAAHAFLNGPESDARQPEDAAGLPEKDGDSKKVGLPHKTAHRVPEKNVGGVSKPKSGPSDNARNPAGVPSGLTRPVPSKTGAKLLNSLEPMFSSLEKLYRLTEGLLRSVAITESAGNQFAVSGAGAKGLFQFMGGTARDMGLHGNDVFDPEKSAQAAAKYLSQLLKANGGDMEKALASYNWGIGNVQKHGMALMPQETREYIPRVLSNMPEEGKTEIHQQNTYHIHGGGDLHAVANEVERRQLSANAQMMRTNQTRTR